MTGTPTLADLLADPARTADLPADAILALLAEATAEQARLGAVERTLLVRLVAEHQNGVAQDRLLTVEEAAAQLGTKEDWLRRQHRLPFRIELSPGQVRYSAKGITRYIAARTGPRR